jgi:hypothetical protein
MTVALIIAVISAWILCLYVGVTLGAPSKLGEVLGHPCRRYTSDFLIGSSICAPIFILIAFMFRRQNKLLLAAIIIPSASLGFYLVTSGMKTYNNISSYGYLARNCNIFGEKHEPERYKTNPEIEEEWDSLQSKLFNHEITKEEFDKERELLQLKQDTWRKERP